MKEFRQTYKHWHFDLISMENRAPSLPDIFMLLIASKQPVQEFPVDFPHDHVHLVHVANSVLRDTVFKQQAFRRGKEPSKRLSGLKVNITTRRSAGDDSPFGV